MDDDLMSTNPKVTQLIELVHHFYPRNIYTTDTRYDSQAEAPRLREIRRRAQEESSAWNALLQRLRQELPECSLWELPYLLYDPCRCVRVSLAKSPVGALEQKALVLLVSVLAPVHHIYASFQRVENKQVVEQRIWHPPLPREYEPVEMPLNALSQEVLGTSRLPNEVLFAPVPDIQIGNLDLGRAQLIHCLFTDRLW
jgi:hypothetical protein